MITCILFLKYLNVGFSSLSYYNGHWNKYTQYQVFLQFIQKSIFFMNWNVLNWRADQEQGNRSQRRKLCVIFCYECATPNDRDCVSFMEMPRFVIGQCCCYGTLHHNAYRPIVWQIWGHLDIYFNHLSWQPLSDLLCTKCRQEVEMLIDVRRK